MHPDYKSLHGCCYQEESNKRVESKRSRRREQKEENIMIGDRDMKQGDMLGSIQNICRIWRDVNFIPSSNVWGQRTRWPEGVNWVTNMI